MENLFNLASLMEQFLLFLPKLVSALVIFVFGLYLAGVLAKGVHRAMKHRQKDPELTDLFRKITRWTVIILGTTAALQTVGFNLTAFLTGLGIVGFTIGFALQDVSKNFVAGMLLLLQQPFEIGDRIKVKDFTGSVKAVDLRATIIQTLDGLIVTIPNADVLTNPITNYSRNDTRRLELRIGVAVDTDLEKAREVTLQAIAELPGVLAEPAPKVVYESFGDFTINYSLYCWINTRETDFVSAKDAGLVKVNHALTQAGIDMPFPTQVVYIRQQDKP